MLARPWPGSLGVMSEQVRADTGPIGSIVRAGIVEQAARTAMTTMELAERKRAERAIWARGDYHAIARAMFWEVGARIVDRLGVQAGERVLDVACGSGNAALRAAASGARVVGVDLTPELLEVGRRLAADAGLEVEWVAGDAEALPVADGSFDVVLSTFGCMFAPRHELAARELARALRPGGRLGICSWTPESALAELGRIVIAHLPPPPEPSQPPFLWGSEDHVRALFDGRRVELHCERGLVEFGFDSLERALQAYETDWGPFVTARERLEPESRWPAVRAELAGVLERRGTTTAAGFTYPGEYLMVIGRRR
jgi:SAM-dependent methyltransferase